MSDRMIGKCHQIPYIRPNVENQIKIDLAQF